MRRMSVRLCDNRIPDKTERCCEHSYCEVRRRKLQNGCIDIPPKGLPWASGLLKYLPGQRDLYCDLYVKAIDREIMKAICNSSCKPKNQKRGKKCSGSSKSKRRRSKRSSRTSGRSSMTSDHSGQPPKGCDCYEVEEVMVFDGECQRLRKGYILRPSKPDSSKDNDGSGRDMEGGGACEDNSSKIDKDRNKPQDDDIICLYLPRSCLEGYTAVEPESDNHNLWDQNASNVGSMKGDAYADESTRDIKEAASAKELSESKDGEMVDAEDKFVVSE